MIQKWNTRNRDGAKKVLGRSDKLSRPWVGSKTLAKNQGEERGKIDIGGVRSE